jgi:hypothetical protein
VNGRDVAVYRFVAAHHPREAGFYRGVACHTRLVAEFPRTLQLRGGGPIRIYRLDEPPRRVSDYFLCSQQADN